MNLPVVPDDDHRTPQMAKNVPQELSHVVLENVVIVKAEKQTQTVSARTHGDRGNRGDAIVTIPMANRRRPASRRPRPANRRDQEKAGFVLEYDVGAQPRSVFFTRGHSSRFHRVISASSRSIARRSGFCGLHPKAWSNRPT